MDVPLLLAFLGLLNYYTDGKPYARAVFGNLVLVKVNTISDGFIYISVNTTLTPDYVIYVST